MSPRTGPSRGSRARSRSSENGSRARSPPSRSSIPPESGSGAEPALRACGGRRGLAAALAVLALDRRELRIVALADRPLEPLAGRDDIPAAEKEEGGANRDRRVVEQVPVVRRVPGRARLVRRT